MPTESPHPATLRIDLDALAAARSIAESEMPNEPFYGAIARAGPPRTLQWQA